MKTLHVGDDAPDFQTVDQEGKPVSLADFRGRRVVLYFYPKDDTPGCTKEACAFRDEFADFRKRNVEVLGVSTDSQKSHRKFAEKFKLPFRLLVDEDKKIVKDYGVWDKKTLYGRLFFGTHRVTYVIDEKGKIAAVWEKVKPAVHAGEILEFLDNSAR
ncbi:MAG TPA: thioredoxin-dependent thiol peroxidase [Thermoanaerobaculia bacterium]|nr:thioredoxin-dependent thiol peroxidase [Thermoanaerobaculia bacterium]